MLYVYQVISLTNFTLIYAGTYGFLILIWFQITQIHERLNKNKTDGKFVTLH